MNSKNLVHLIITLLLVMGIYGAGSLVWQDIQTCNGCPKIGIVPICAIVLICFVIPFIVHVTNKYGVLYFIFAGLALSIAFVASILQYIGHGECPKLTNGTPMCYLSFSLFTILILLKFILLRQPKIAQQ